MQLTNGQGNQKIFQLADWQKWKDTCYPVPMRLRTAKFVENNLQLIKVFGLTRLEVYQQK